MNHAQKLAQAVKGMSAWNLPREQAAAVQRRHYNQYGSVYVFADNSRAFIPKGSPTVIVSA